MQLYTKILIGLIAGIVVGTVANWADIVWLQDLLQSIEPIGTVFIRLIMMIVIPLVVASLILGTASLGDLRKLGRLGGKTVMIYLFTTAVAVSIGLLLSNIVRPGSRIDPTTRDTISAAWSEDAAGRMTLAAEKPTVIETLVNMVPNNPFQSAANGDLLPLIIFSIIFGAAISVIARERRDMVLTFFNGVNDAVMVMIDWIMKLAPYAVFALIAAVISRFGMDVLQSLAIYAGVVVTGLTLHTIGTYGTMVAVLGRFNPIEFFRRIREVPLIAFSTSSSNATLPVTMETAEEELGVSKGISSFVLPLGATINMDGTALYQGVATVFIAQVYGVDLSFTQLLTIVLTATLASIGTAGVPSAGIVMLILVLQSVGMAGQAAAGIALILGVDRILDMLRTVTNVIGDLSASLIVARSEGEALVPRSVEHSVDLGPPSGIEPAGVDVSEVPPRE